MTRPRVKIRGQRGRWVAGVEGRTLAVLHNTHWTPPSAYFARIRPEDVGGNKLAELLAALEREASGGAPLVVMQRDKGPNLERDGYIGVFAFKDLKIEAEATITLAITERYADPA